MNNWVAVPYANQAQDVQVLFVFEDWGSFLGPLAWWEKCPSVLKVG